jgi:hypothetical protein
MVQERRREERTVYHYALEEHDARVVFERIAEQKLISFRDLEDSLRRDGEVRNDLGGVVEYLIEQRLIQRQEAPIEDFETYHLTLDGMSAYRTLRRMKPKKRNGRLFKSSA